jgi:hypothetical protein
MTEVCNQAFNQLDQKHLTEFRNGVYLDSDHRDRR